MLLGFTQHRCAVRFEALILLFTWHGRCLTMPNIRNLLEAIGCPHGLSHLGLGALEIVRLHRWNGFTFHMFHIGVKIPKLTFCKRTNQNTISISESHWTHQRLWACSASEKCGWCVTGERDPSTDPVRPKKRDRYTSDMIHIGAPQGRLTTVQVLNLILKILQAYTFANDCRLQNADIHIDWMSSCIPSDFVKLLRVSCCMQKILQRTRTFSQRLRAAKVAKFS